MRPDRGPRGGPCAPLSRGRPLWGRPPKGRTERSPLPRRALPGEPSALRGAAPPRWAATPARRAQGPEAWGLQSPGGLMGRSDSLKRAPPRAHGGARPDTHRTPYGVMPGPLPGG